MSDRKYRVAFVGQSTYFKSSSLSIETPSIEPFFIEFRSGSEISTFQFQIEKIQPDILVCFRPEIFPASSLSKISALKIGWFTEPLPKGDSKESIHTPFHPLEQVDDKLLGKMRNSANDDLSRRLAQTVATDIEQFDLFISFDPLIVDTLEKEIAPIWKSLPLPVDDSYFRPLAKLQLPARFGFFGRPTAHRDRYLNNHLHAFDIRYFAHGIFDDDMRVAFERLDVGINIHNEYYLNYENRVSLHLAAGHLVVSEPLRPLHGLEPGHDYIEVANPTEFELVLREIIPVSRSV